MQSKGEQFLRCNCPAVSDCIPCGIRQIVKIVVCDTKPEFLIASGRFLEIFSMECPFTGEEHHDARRGNTKADALYEKAFQAAMEAFNRRVDAIADTACSPSSDAGWFA